MLNESTINKLANIFSTLGLSLRETEIQKEVLVRQPDFVVLNLFRRIDKQGKDFITSLDFLNFFRENKLIISEQDAFALISQFDDNHDGKLSLVNFQIMVTPHGYSQKKNLLSMKKFYKYGESQPKLSYDVEFGLLQVIQRELECLKSIEKQKQNLITSFDWSALAAFKIIDEYSHRSVNNDNLRVFFKKFDNCMCLTEEDITNIIRYYDRNVDGEWNFKEFIDFTSPKLQYQQKAEDIHKVQIDETSPQIFELENVEDQEQKENAKSLRSIKTSTTAITSPQTHSRQALEQMNSRINMRNQGIHSALDIDLTNNTLFKTQNDIIMNYPYGFDKDSQKNQEDVDFQEKLHSKSREINLMKINQNSFLNGSGSYTVQNEDISDGKMGIAQSFIDMMEVESVQEKKRRDLALRSDFNLNDAFKLFNSVKNNKRGIDCDDFYYVLKDVLGVSITHDEVFILFYKLDRDGDGFISYNELTQAFIPKQHEYAILIQSRKAFYGEFTPIRDYFKGDTKEVLKKMIRGMIDCEVSIELIRQRIHNKNRFNCDKAYRIIDVKSSGQVTINELREFLRGVNVYPVERELSMLFDRFDKDEDGVIAYHEFVAGLTPFMNSNKV